MALQTSGSLGFSEIVSEFGGVNSHSLSEYYPLAGQGVTGIPASGTISFSDFLGKDKDVITSTWVTSSSSVTDWVHRYTGQGGGYTDPDTYMQSYDGTWHIWSAGAVAAGYGSTSYFSFVSSGGTHTVGTLRYRRGGFVETVGNNNGDRYYYQLLVDSYDTVVTDTSGYVDIATVATITT
jgi:hypothetical protein